MSKFKQTTLFGSLAKDQDEHIYKHPANTYEKFIGVGLIGCPETADRGDDSTLCVVCELGEDEDEED